MVGTPTRVAAALLGRRARRRWVFQVLGGALLMPYFLVAQVFCQVVNLPMWRPALLLQVAAYVLAIPLVAATSLLPAVRPLEVAATAALLDVEVSGGPALSWSARRRAALWYVLHLAVGAVVAGASFGLPPAAVLFIVFPLLGGPSWLDSPDPAHSIDSLGFWAPLIGVALLAGLVLLNAGVGAGLARLAAVLLGPSSAERLAELELHAAKLAERNRLARELHDSVGHALSVVTIQAGAAGRVLARDPAFAREALSAIQRTASDALADLDQVLGLLRDEPAGTTVPPTLSELDALLDRARTAGVAVDAHISADVARVPAVVSREAYRIVQEGLTNAVRHAGQVLVSLCLTISPPSKDGDSLHAARGTRGVRADSCFLARCRHRCRSYPRSTGV